MIKPIDGHEFEDDNAELNLWVSLNISLHKNILYKNVINLDVYIFVRLNILNMFGVIR